MPLDLEHSRAVLQGAAYGPGVPMSSSLPPPDPNPPRQRFFTAVCRSTTTAGNKQPCFCLIDHVSDEHHHHGARVPSDWERRPCGKLASSMPHIVGSLPRPKGKHLLALCILPRSNRAQFFAGIPMGSIGWKQVPRPQRRPSPPSWDSGARNHMCCMPACNHSRTTSSRVLEVCTVDRWMRVPRQPTRYCINSSSISRCGRAVHSHGGPVLNSTMLSHSHLSITSKEDKQTSEHHLWKSDSYRDKYGRYPIIAQTATPRTPKHNT